MNAIERQFYYLPKKSNTSITMNTIKYKFAWFSILTRNLDLKNFCHVLGLKKGNKSKATRAISKYKIPATRVHCILILNMILSKY